MGTINDPFSENKLSFSKISDILNNLLLKDENQSKNKQILQEIGFLKEYSYITSERVFNEVIYYSIMNKIIRNVVNGTILRINFLEWSRYFFDITDKDLDSIDQFNKKIEKLKLQPLNKEFFQKNIKKYLFQKNNFKKLLNYGIPNNFRIFIWDIIINEKYNEHHYFNYDQELKEYKSILEKPLNNPQIEKDLNRTFMTVTDQTNKNIQSLRNILNCINKYNLSGYCQGMNYIIGYILKLTNFDEVLTFYIFKNILFDIKGYFEVGFPLLKKNNDLFNKNFKELYPKLFIHFQKNEIVNEFWVGKWFQTLFTITLPFGELNIVWDALLLKGFDFIIYISLAIIDYIEKDLLKLKESDDIISYFDKVLNPQVTTSINKKFFDNIYNHIIPMNEILIKADEIENKINGEKNNKINYDRRKSDNHLNNFRFNNLNNLNRIKNEKEEKKTIKISDKNLNEDLFKKNISLPSQFSTELSNKNNNTLKNSNLINSKNNILINSNISNLGNYSLGLINNNQINSQNKKMFFYSSNNLPVYNFNDLGNISKRGSLDEINFNLYKLNNINNMSIFPEMMKNPYLKTNYTNNIGISTNRNYLVYYP